MSVGLRAPSFSGSGGWQFCTGCSRLVPISPLALSDVGPIISTPVSSSLSGGNSSTRMAERVWEHNACNKVS